jgi:hypothetical protein
VIQFEPQRRDSMNTFDDRQKNQRVKFFADEAARAGML